MDGGGLFTCILFLCVYKVHMSGKKNINELAKYVDLDMIPAIAGGNSQVPVYERLVRL